MAHPTVRLAHPVTLPSGIRLPSGLPVSIIGRLRHGIVMATHHTLARPVFLNPGDIIDEHVAFTSELATGMCVRRRSTSAWEVVVEITDVDDDHRDVTVAGPDGTRVEQAPVTATWNVAT